MSGQKSRVRLTAGRVADFSCPPGKSQAFLWDTEATALALRVTPTGRRTYVFESRLNGATIRLNIGTAADWSLDAARTKAQGLKMMVDAGTDPREVEREQQAAQVASKAAAAAQAVTVGEVWSAYLEARRPHWGVRHHADHGRLVQPGGVPARRGTRGRGVTVAGPLHSLMCLPLCELNNAAVEAWASKEAKTRPTSARLAWRCLKAFLAWCAEQPEYVSALAGVNPAKTKKAREALGKAGVKQDALMREQLPAWFAAVRQIGNPVTAAYLQILL